MTTNPNQPHQGNRDAGSRRPEAATGVQEPHARAGQQRVESTPQAGGQHASTAQVMECLDRIEENVAKVRTALGSQNRELTDQLNQAYGSESTKRQGSSPHQQL